MAIRPVYVAIPIAPYYKRVDVEFTYFSGFSVAQKRRNIEAIHNAYLARNPSAQLLEISSKSLNPLGIRLSAFHLKKYIPSIGASVPVENAYQGSKRFAQGGPYTDLYLTSPREAKRDTRLQDSGPLKAFTFEGEDYPLVPTNAFYDWLYICAIQENPELARSVLAYDGFTDVEFNPNKSLNCQARAAAIFVGMSQAGLLHSPLCFSALADSSLKTKKQ